MSIRQLQKVGRWLKQEINIKNKLDMKIIAKQGSALEKLLKQMNERLLREQDEAKDMIQEYCGSRPDSIGYVWAFGFTAEWF